MPVLVGLRCSSGHLTNLPGCPLKLLEDQEASFDSCQLRRLSALAAALAVHLVGDQSVEWVPALVRGGRGSPTFSTTVNGPVTKLRHIGSIVEASIVIKQDHQDPASQLASLR